MRLLMELKTSDCASFVTLTYNNENLPEDRSLHKEDVSDFNKAFRQRFNEKKIKFFACGEYGDNPERLTFFGDDVDSELIKRPHYHSIMFNVDNSLSTREMLFDSWNKCDSWKFFGKTWFKTVGDVTPDSCQYVSGYCQKKLFGDKADEEYQGKLPPFQLQSQMIGETYFLQHIEQYLKDGCIYFNSKYHPIPDTWKKKFDIRLSPEVINKNLQRAVDKYNERWNENLTVKDLHLMWMGSATVGSPYDFIEKCAADEEAYQQYVDIINNLRGKRK